MTLREDRAAIMPVLMIAAACALLLALPGRTVTNAYVNDLFIFLDGAYRVVSGQVPNRDFHTALGPLVYYLPAAGFLISGNLGGAMPAGTAVFLLALAPMMAHVLGSRLRPAIAVPFAAFLLLIVAVPMNLGDAVTALSFGMFYNRIGWACLAALLVMYLRPERPRRHQTLLDASCASFFCLVMLYTKISYGLVALAFMTFLLLDGRQRRWAAPALAVVLMIGLLVEAAWRSSLAHFSDVLLTGEVSGLRTSVVDLVDPILRHLADCVLFGLLAGLALWRTRSLRDLLFYGFCAVSGLLIFVQNSQTWGIITLHAGAAVAAERFMRRSPLAGAHVLAAAPELTPDRAWARLPDQVHGKLPGAYTLTAGVPVLLLALLLPTIVHCAMALTLHTALAATRAGEAMALPKLYGVRFVKLWSPGHYDFVVRYVSSLRDGARALNRLDPEASHVFVLDFVNPFSAGLGLEPPRGDSSWLHWGRNVDAAHFIPPDRLLQDVQVVMEPKWGINNDPLRRVYGSYLRTKYDLVDETDYWRVHRSRQQQARGTPAPSLAQEN